MSSMKYVVAMFGEAEKGTVRIPHTVKELGQLMDQFGNCPEGSQGLFFAVQSLLYNRDVIYFRVEEEGFSKADYFIGLKYLSAQDVKMHALCLPGVGDDEILQASQLICEKQGSFIISTQKDLYDYLTSC